jgi:hypothetical protein
MVDDATRLYDIGLGGVLHCTGVAPWVRRWVTVYMDTELL